jgi:hypothetical protein
MRRRLGSSLSAALLAGGVAAGCFDLDPLTAGRGSVADGGDPVNDAGPGGGDASPDAADGGPRFGAPVTLATGQPGPRSVALDATHVYWTNYEGGTLAKVPKGGAPAPTILVTGEVNPRDVLVDAVRLFWLSRSSDMRSSSIDGTSPGDFAYMGGAARLTADPVAFYAVGDRPSMFRRLKTAGPATETLLPNGSTYTAIASDGANTFVGSSRGVLAGPTGTVPTPFAPNEGAINDLVADATTVYWITASGRLAKLDADKMGQTPVLLTDKQNGGIRLALDAANVYWTAAGAGAGDGKVRAIPKAGGAVTELAGGLNEPFGIAVDASGVYWANHGDGTLMKVTR